MSSPDPAVATAVTKAEKATRDAWVRRHWTQRTAAKQAPGLIVLANHDPVIRNGRGKRPLTPGDKQYRRGLYCHAVSRVIVRLPSPGTTFTAVVGVDTNDDTKPRRGSVIFTVTVGRKQAFRSKVMREGMPGAAVRVDLAGATSFELGVEDATVHRGRR